jgi:hypothetical protein
MAIIYSYPKGSDIELTNTLLGTNSDNRTVNFMIGDLINYINTHGGGGGGGTFIDGNGFVKAAGTAIYYDNSTYISSAGAQPITGIKTFTENVIIDRPGGATTSDSIILKEAGAQVGRISVNGDEGFDLFTSADKSGYGISFDVNDSGALLFYANNAFSPKFAVRDDYNFSQQDLYSTRFIKLGGAPNQYLMADGSTRVGLFPIPAPATPGESGIAGEIRYDSQYIYICVSTNSWRRTALSLW